MSALLVEWIAKTVGQELGEGLQWRENNANNSLSTGRVGDLAIEDDGSSLRLKSPKPRIVQIIKFETFDERPKATVSDGKARIKVKISSDASQRYSAKSNRSLTHGTPGGLIQLLDFDIVATHRGPRQERITIDVNDFKSIGANGSGNFGFATPYSVESCREIKELLQKLEALRSRDSGGDQLSPNPSIRSQFSTTSSVAEFESISQAGFATQAPFSGMPAVRSLKAGISGKQSGAGLTPPRADTNNTDALSNGSYSKNGASDNSLSDTEQIHPGRPTVNGKKDLAHASAALLGLVQQAQPIVKVNPILRVTTKPPAAISAPGGRGMKMQGEGRIENSGPSPTSFTGVPSQKSPVKETTTSLPKPAANHEPVPTAMTREQTQRPTRNRISSRDVRIPKDQEALLDSENSWLPAEPGHRDPVANIPISILQSLNREADLDTRRVTNPRKRKRGINIANEAQSVKAETPNDSESDVPASSGEWPPSPDRNQLPPDSSMASAEHSEDQSRRRPVAPHSPGSLTRIPVNQSLTSSPVTMPPPTAAPGLASTRTSMEPSPSAISNLTGEDKALFKCGAIDCGKTYKNAISLDYHTERCHGDRGLRQIHKCTREECDKSYTTSGALKYHIEQCHDSRNVSLLAMSTQVSIEYPAQNEPSVSMDVASQSSESDLEMKVPDPLTEVGTINQDSAPMQRFPSTASQPELPITQVKRTPYPNGQKRLIELRSPSKSESPGHPNGSPPDSTSHVTLSVSENLAGPSAETHPPTVNGGSVILRNPEMDKITINDHGPNEAVMLETIKLDSDHETQILLEGPIPAVQSADELPQRLSTNGIDTPRCGSETQQLMNSPPRGDKLKRKSEDANSLSPNMSKRREFRANFEFSQELEDRQDPSEGARKIREEFLASRKSSEGGRPMQSPTRLPHHRLNKPCISVETPLAGVEITHTKTNSHEKADTEDDECQQAVKAVETSSASVRGSPLLGLVLNRMHLAADASHPAKSSPMHLEQTIQPLEINMDVDTPTIQQESRPTALDDDEAKSGAQDQQSEEIGVDRAPEAIVEDPRNGSHEVLIVEKEASSEPATLFDRFQRTYPSYSGDLKHFVAMCTKIGSLLSAGRMEHQSLWDDFIIRQKTEYAQYVVQCTEEGKDPMTYEVFYRSEILEPQFRKLVLTRRNLDEALSLSSKKQNEVKGKDDINQNPRAHFQTTSPSTSSAVSKERRSISIIDLTGDDRGKQRKKPKETVLESSSPCKQTPSRRSVPWKEHSPPFGSDGAQGPPGSSQHARFKEFMNTVKSFRSPAYKPTARDRHDRPVSRGAMILSGWGVTPNDVLKTKYFEGITQRQINLMKEIAQDVDLAEGRCLIEKQISSRTRHVPGSATPKLTDNDLEVVRDTVLQRKQASAEIQTKRSRDGNDSSMTTSDPISTSQANALEVLRDPGGSDEWWRDESTPFNTFARAYASIRPGTGNAYAEAEVSGTKSGREGRGTGGMDWPPKLRKIDILSWEL